MNDKITFSVCVYLKKSNSTKSNLSYLYMRITMNGQRTEISLDRKIDPDCWDSYKGQVTGRNQESTSINDYVEECKAKVRRCKFGLEKEDSLVTPDTIKRKYFGLEAGQKSLIDLFDDFIKYKKERVGVDIAKSTVQKYQRCRDQLLKFITIKYRTKDFSLRDVNHEFVMGWEHHLRTKGKLSQNTTVKTIRLFRVLINNALANDWLAKDPFIKVRLSEEQIERESLTMEELHRIWKKEFKIERIQQVADIFLFGCFTGMAYSYLKELTIKELNDGSRGKKWIIKKRKKTGTPINIRLPEPAIVILEKYAQHPVRLRNGKLLPVSSNQKMNAYLKEVGDLCGITKSLTTHMARHTFATTLGIGLGMPLNVVSRVLAHRSQSMTEHYARISDQVIDQEMTKVDNAFRVSRTA